MKKIQQIVMESQLIRSERNSKMRKITIKDLQNPSKNKLKIEKSLSTCVMSLK